MYVRFEVVRVEGDLVHVRLARTDGRPGAGPGLAVTLHSGQAVSVDNGDGIDGALVLWDELGVDGAAHERAELGDRFDESEPWAKSYTRAAELDANDDVRDRTYRCSRVAFAADGRKL